MTQTSCILKTLVTTLFPPTNPVLHSSQIIILTCSFNRHFGVIKLWELWGDLLWKEGNPSLPTLTRIAYLNITQNMCVLQRLNQAQWLNIIITLTLEVLVIVTLIYYTNLKGISNSNNNILIFKAIVIVIVIYYTTFGGISNINNNRYKIVCCG